MVKESKLYKYLRRLKKTYSKEELYNMGKNLSYYERLKYDYKLECLYNKSHYMESLALVEHEDNFINKLINNNELDYIINNLNEIIRDEEYTVRKELLDYLKNQIDNISIEKQTKIGILIVKALVNYKDIEVRDLAKIYLILNDVAKKEDKTLFDIEKVYNGGYSKVYRINNSVIKIGKNRACAEIADNNRILLPEYKGYVGNIFIEITDYLPNKENIGEEDVYEIYKELREQGVIWKDPTRKNLARIDEKTIQKQIERRKRKKELGIRENPNYIDHLVFDYEKEKIRDLDCNLNPELIKKTKEYEKSIKSKKKVL